MPLWRRKPRNPELPANAVEAIARRRRQILVHSCIYYILDDNIISDDQWQKWADQLVRLQKKFGWRIGFYDKAFRGFTGATGHHLPIDDDGVMVTAKRMLVYRDSRSVL